VLGTVLLAPFSWTAHVHAHPLDAEQEQITPGIAGQSQRCAETPERTSGLAATGESASRPRAVAVRTSSPPQIDGALDDAAWRCAERLTSFVQERPFEGAPASESMEVRLAYDSQNLYIGIHAYYSDLSIIRAGRADRDQIDDDDTVTVWFDTYLDQQRAYAFTVNAYGVQGDSLVSAGGGGSGGGGGAGGARRNRGAGNSSWDALFESAAAVVANGWTAELAIPFKSLRYPGRAADEAHAWGFQIRRTIGGKNESDVWAPVTTQIYGWMRQFGVLDGMSDLSPSRNLELLPTVTAIRTRTLEGAAVYGHDVAREAGVSVKYGITSTLTVDFTLNPDFSQIESDHPQIQVNQRFPLFFEELRPFFLEGQEIFRVAGNLLHTRTIVDPRYGAKLTGKVGRWVLGAIVADDEAPGRVEPPESGHSETAQLAIGRVRLDVGSDSNVGLMVTNREFRDTHSRVGAIDAQFRLDATQRLSLRAVTSHHRDEEGINRRGAMYGADYRREGRHIRASAHLFSISPQFKTDMGFVPRVDERRFGGDVAYVLWPGGWVTDWGPSVTYSRNYTHGGVLQDEEYRVGVDVAFSSNLTVNSDVSRELERFEGIDFRKTRFNFGGRIDTSRRVSLRGFIDVGDDVRYIVGSFLGKGQQANLTAAIRPFSRLLSEIDLNWSRFVDTRGGAESFNAKVWRVRTSYQLTDRLLMRSVFDFDDYDETLGGNFLLTYRVNAGTVFFVGYDDRYQRGGITGVGRLPTSRLERTNQAVFTKLQVLLRY